MVKRIEKEESSISPKNNGLGPVAREKYVYELSTMQLMEC
jgi:hypothetical protein